MVQENPRTVNGTADTLLISTMVHDLADDLEERSRTLRTLADNLSAITRGHDLEPPTVDRAIVARLYWRLACAVDRANGDDLLTSMIRSGDVDGLLEEHALASAIDRAALSALAENGGAP